MKTSINTKSQRRLQAYLTGLATTTGLVASSGAAIVQINNLTPGIGTILGLTNGGVDLWSMDIFLLTSGPSGYAQTYLNVYNGADGYLGLSIRDNGSGVSGIVSDGWAHNFAFGEVIPQVPPLDLTQNIYFSCFSFANGAYDADPFPANPKSYIGFIDGNARSGWLEVTWDPTGTVANPNGEFKVIAGAYEDVPLTSIGAGLVAVPEPGSLLALSGLLGSSLFLRSRRRKAAVLA